MLWIKGRGTRVDVMVMGGHTVVVKDQAGLDAALAEHGQDPSWTIEIRSPRDPTLRLRGPILAHVEARDQSTVRAFGRVTVEARDKAVVAAYGRATVEAHNASGVYAYDRAGVYAYDRSTVCAFDMSTVRAFGASIIEARNLSSVVAFNRATVAAREQSTVAAHARSTVYACDQSIVVAGKFTAIHVHSLDADIQGGVVVDHTALDLDNPRDWVEYTGVQVTDDGMVVLYKAVDDQYTAGHGHTPTVYQPGTVVTAADWEDDGVRGHGLHAYPYPHQARDFLPRHGIRMLQVACPLEDLRPLGGCEAKARSFDVMCEVDLNGTPLNS